MDSEEKVSAIVKKITAPGYGHADNIFRKFYDLEREVGHDPAVDVIYQKVVIEDGQY